MGISRHAINYITATVPLINGWVPFGSPFDTLQAYKQGGFVKLEGVIKGGTSVSGSTVATLPVGWRPKYTSIHMCPTGNGTNGICRVDVYTNGTIVIDDNNGSSQWLSLSNIQIVI